MFLGDYQGWLKVDAYGVDDGVYLSSDGRIIASCCMAHARRKFIEIEESFPLACGVVLEAIGKVYGYEAETRGMSAEDRLAHHQARSGPVIAKLYEWIERPFEQRLVEPNSSLGQALRYLQRHRLELTKFLSLVNIPLDNNPAV